MSDFYIRDLSLADRVCIVVAGVISAFSFSVSCWKLNGDSSDSNSTTDNLIGVGAMTVSLLSLMPVAIIMKMARERAALLQSENTRLLPGGVNVDEPISSVEVVVPEGETGSQMPRPRSTSTVMFPVVAGAEMQTTRRNQVPETENTREAAAFS